MTTHDDDQFATRLADALGARADQLDVPAGDVDAVVGAGRRHERLVLGGVAVATVVALAGAAAGVARLFDELPGVAIDDVATESATPTPTPTPVPTATPDAPPATATPTPERPTSPSPTPTTDAAATTTAPRPDLVLATDAGVVRWSGGEPTSVPGLDGPVTAAFEDGDGGVVFQRNDVGIGRLVDGRIDTIVALSQFADRAFDRAPGLALPATRLLLDDVEAGTGRVVFRVDHTGTDDAGLPVRHTVVHELRLPDRTPRELEARFTWDEGYDLVSAGGGRTVATYAVQAGRFAYDLGAAAQRLVEATDADPATGELSDLQVADDGATVAFVRRRGGAGQELVVLDAATGEERRVLPLASLDGTDQLGRFAVVTDHAAGHAVLGGDEVPASTRPVLVDLARGTATTLDTAGRATLVP